MYLHNTFLCIIFAMKTFPKFQRTWDYTDWEGERWRHRILVTYLTIFCQLYRIAEAYDNRPLSIAEDIVHFLILSPTPLSRLYVTIIIDAKFTSTQAFSPSCIFKFLVPVLGLLNQESWFLFQIFANQALRPLTKTWTSKMMARTLTSWGALIGPSSRYQQLDL